MVKSIYFLSSTFVVYCEMSGVYLCRVVKQVRSPFELVSLINIIVETLPVATVLNSVLHGIDCFDCFSKIWVSGKQFIMVQHIQ